MRQLCRVCRVSDRILYETVNEASGSRRPEDNDEYQSSYNSRSDMDIFGSRYFRINKILLMCLGLWPFQRRLYKNLIRIIQASINISIVIPEVKFIDRQRDVPFLASIF